MSRPLTSWCRRPRELRASISPAASAAAYVSEQSLDLHAGRDGASARGRRASGARQARRGASFAMQISRALFSYVESAPDGRRYVVCACCSTYEPFTSRTQYIFAETITGSGTGAHADTVRARAYTGRHA